MTVTIRSAGVLLASLSIALLANADIPGASRSFYGMAYSPDGAILPNCGALQANVTRDIANMAQLTPRIRLYGSDCNQTAMVLQGIKDAGNVDLSVWLGVFIDGNDTVYQRQMSAVVDAIKTYGTDHIAGITVGNEFLLLSYGDGGSPTDPKGVAARTTLLNYIQETNKTIQALKLDKTIPLGTADAGSSITKELCAGADYVMANVHPWFGKVAIDQAATWTWQFFQDFDVKVCAQASNQPIMYIAETGWPTATDNATLSSAWPSAASVPNLQKFLDTFVCQANTNETNYFYFEYKDEPWKKIYGGVEPYWGLFDSDAKLKDIKLPNCPVKSPTGKAVVVSPPSATAPATGSGSGGSSQGGAKKSDAPLCGLNSVSLISSLVLAAALAIIQ